MNSSFLIVMGNEKAKAAAVLKTRRDVYRKDTLNLLKHYPKDLLAVFNADQKPLEVLRDVLVKLSPILAI